MEIEKLALEEHRECEGHAELLLQVASLNRFLDIGNADDFRLAPERVARVQQLHLRAALKQVQLALKKRKESRQEYIATELYTLLYLNSLVIAK
jgi:hypothetical protein